MTVPINMMNHKMVNLPNPTNPSDPTTKQYVDYNVPNRDVQGNWNFGNKNIYNIRDPANDLDGVNKKWVLGLEGRFLIFGNITKGAFKDNLGNDLKLGPTKLKKISIKSDVVENNAYLRIDPTRGAPSFFRLSLKKGTNNLNTNTKFAGIHIIEMWKRTPPFSSPDHWPGFNGQYQLELSTLGI